MSRVFAPLHKHPPEGGRSVPHPRIRVFLGGTFSWFAVGAALRLGPVIGRIGAEVPAKGSRETAAALVTSLHRNLVYRIRVCGEQAGCVAHP